MLVREGHGHQKEKQRRSQSPDGETPKRKGRTREKYDHPKRPKERKAATAALVEKHSKEMMCLIQDKRSEHIIDGEPTQYPAQPPPPLPPPQTKLDIYVHPDEFAEVDRLAIQVAQEDQKTFTDLVRMLVGQCSSDVEKARTIFRWITVKNLNSMTFDESAHGDTPMALLRGIKYGTESYHVLFKRLCSYAGLHCVVIKGYSKSAGYQPGIRFEDNRFRNSWNAVYVAGAWRFVQCNWGARHLVNAKEVPKTGGKSKNDRAATIRIGMPQDMQSSLIFHYNLKLYDSDKDVFDNTSLKRFVMQSVVGNLVAFRVHAPCSGALLLDIFANAVTPREYLTGEPMKFKSVCKFKIVCEDLHTVMVPLPDCASGEWGPVKATRLFGLEPVTHQDALIFAGRDLDLQFRMTRPLTDFMATLHRNGYEEKKLSKYVSHKVTGDVVNFTLSFPEEGQYGMDIYTREVSTPDIGGVQSSGEKHLLTHCCKYLINSSKKN
ncbi:Hillarin [Armadillidium vulgare]|nr:Hillarin [Armadillidium vulgare]